MRGILALAELYPSEVLASAFTAAREYNTYSHSFVRGLLEKSGATRQAKVPIFALPVSRSSVVVDLGEYQRILEGAR